MNPDIERLINSFLPVCKLCRGQHKSCYFRVNRQVLICYDCIIQAGKFILQHRFSTVVT